MSLLREIQRAATSDKPNLATLLRKLMVLATRLGSTELRAWASSELNGYGDEDPLPAYRLTKTLIKGTLVTPIERAQNVPLRIDGLPRDIQAKLSVMRLQTGVAALQRLAETNEPSLHVGLTAELAAAIGSQYESHVTCMSAYRVLPVQMVVGALDAVCTRVLEFALEIEEANPNAGEAEPGEQPVPREVVHQKFETIILGDNATVNSGAGTQVRVETVNVGDFASLSSALRHAGVPETEITALAKAVDADAAEPKKGIGRHVGEWLEKVSASATGGVVAKLVGAFLGVA